jgi:tetratricopeptide (TPR) repeat protein
MGKEPHDYLEYSQKTEGDSVQTTFRIHEISKSEEALKLLGEGKLKEALVVIDDAVESEPDDFENWNAKALILNGLSEYEQSIECFEAALKLNDCDEIRKNKADALHGFSKVTFFPTGDLDKAMMLIDEALDILPEGEDPSEYWFLKAEIFEGMGHPFETRICYLKAQGEFEKASELDSQLEILRNGSDVLITVSGTDFFKGLDVFFEGAVLDLVREPENEHDSDAIRIEIGGEAVGYVANNDYTAIEGTKKASEIVNVIGDSQKAEVSFILMNQHVIARLIH